MRQTYKYYAGITSQIPFCSTPLRLDTYNSCQYACSYCFASTRQGFGRDEKLQISNPDALEKRLNRVAKGDIKSVLDEFIYQRIPFQLGGMSDPFAPIEKREKRTLEYLRILKEYDYPYLISTKSDLIATDEYLNVVEGSNGYIRFSTTVVSEELRPKIDKGCPSIQNIAEAASRLTNKQIPVSFRFQPIVPGFEENAYELINIAKNSGVSHISAEYLKVPIDADLNFGIELKKLLNDRPVAYYKSLGASKDGREYSLPISYKIQHLPRLFKYAKDCGLTFGFADNELLLHSSGDSCCNAANLYLKNASFFRANIVALAKSKQVGEEIRFDEYLEEWIPSHAVSTYFNSKGRLPTECFGEAEWVSYLRKMWIGDHGVFSPSFFNGIANTFTFDKNGLPIFKRVMTDFEKCLA